MHLVGLPEILKICLMERHVFRVALGPYETKALIRDTY